MTTITTWSEFESACAKPNVVFRGQTTHYGNLIPSLFRKPLPPNYSSLSEAATKLYLNAYQIYEKVQSAMDRDTTPFVPDPDDDDPDEPNWVSDYGVPLRAVPGHGFGTSSDHEPAGAVLWFLTEENHPYRHAILQHYGAPTPALDVSFDPGIALWFATHEFRSDPGGVAHHYQSEKRGVVYLISSSNVPIIDLRAKGELPSAGLRAQRQHGALLLGATSAQPDLAQHLVETLSVDIGVFRSAPAPISSLTQAQLFPPRAEDRFFDALLNARLSNDATERALGQYFIVYV